MPLLVTASLVQLSRLVLGGDTGLVHLAVAMGKRVIMIMRTLQAGACFAFGHREWAILPQEGLPVAALAAGVCQSGLYRGSPEQVNRRRTCQQLSVCYGTHHGS